MHFPDLCRYSGCMISRRKAREAVLQALYQCDALKEWSFECADLYFSHFQQEALVSEDPVIRDNFSYAETVCKGIIEKLSLIDSAISSASERWSVNRMSQVDRNIIRISTYEILFCEDIPVKVSINEAIEIAKRYGTKDTSVFVNGILDKVATSVSKDK